MVLKDDVSPVEVMDFAMGQIGQSVFVLVCHDCGTVLESRLAESFDEVGL